MDIFIEIDLSQAEWVVTAYASRDTRMIDIVESDKDPHLETGHLISTAPYDYIRAENDAIGHITNPDDIVEIRSKLADRWPEVRDNKWFLPRVMSVRQAGKKSNHGLNYDMRYRRFALENEMPEKDAERIVDKYHAAYSGLRNIYYTWIEMCLRKDCTLRDCFGNKREFRKAWGHDLLAAAYAWLPQSTVGEIGKRAVRRVYNDDSIHMKHTEVAANVHDSILVQSRHESVDHTLFVANRLRRHMKETCEYHGRSFEIRTDVKIGTNWGVMEVVNLDVLDPADELRRALEVVQAKVQ